MGPCLLLLSSVVLAGEVEALDVSEFGAGRGQALDGREGWVSGFAEDRWWGTRDVALPMTDLDVSDRPGEGYGSGWAADNWLLNGPVGQDVEVRVRWSNQDDDALGLVLSHDGASTFYLVAVSRDAVPPPLPPVEIASARLVVLRVEAGEASILADEALDLPRDLTLRVRMDDGSMLIRTDAADPLVLEDPLPLPGGQVGFYAYDNGFDGDGSAFGTFDLIRMVWLDGDDDRVIDDEDNCEDVANPAQEDEDGDGIGDACEEPVDTDVPDTGDTDTPDTDAPVDTGTDTDVRPRLGGAGCACSTAPADLSWFPLGLLVLVGVRRRR